MDTLSGGSKSIAELGGGAWILVERAAVVCESVIVEKSSYPGVEKPARVIAARLVQRE